MAIEVQNMKTVLAVAPVALASAATATAVEVDAQGWSNARFIFQIGDAGATTNLGTVKIQSATSSGGSFSDVSGASFSSGIDADASDNTVHAIEIDLTDKGVGEFLQVVMTEDGGGANTVPCSVLCILSRGADCPTSATERGLSTETLA